MLEVANLMYFDGLKENAKTNKYMLSYKYKKYNKLLKWNYSFMARWTSFILNIQIKNILIWFDLDRQNVAASLLFVYNKSFYGLQISVNINMYIIVLVIYYTFLFWYLYYLYYI